MSEILDANGLLSALNNLDSNADDFERDVSRLVEKSRTVPISAKFRDKIIQGFEMHALFVSDHLKRVIDERIREIEEGRI